MSSSSASFFTPSLPHWPAYTPLPLPGTPASRTLALLEALGHPHHRLPPVIHIGGTRGKGSTLAFLRSILTQAGYRVHAYTSPHLERFNERIMLAGKEIEDEALFTLLEETRIAANGNPVGFFDGTTAAALLAFSRTPADIVLLETGLGGAPDATNVVESPLLTVLTTISHDHTAIMGTGLPEIATFEAGILKPGAPCIVSYQHESTVPALQAASRAVEAPLYAYGRHWLTLKTPHGMLFRDGNGDAALPLPALIGAHQIVNAGNAIAAISLLQDFQVEERHIIAGLMQVQWKGRLERLNVTCLPACSELWFDGGHNEAAAGVIAHHAGTHWHDKPLYLVFGTSKGKEVGSMLAHFGEIAARIYSVQVQSEPDSYSAEAICSLAPAHNIIPAASITAALEAIAHKRAAPFRVLIFGSLYLWPEAIRIK